VRTGIDPTPTPVLEVTLTNVVVTKLVAGKESCTGTTCPAPADTLFLTFDRIHVDHGTDSGVDYNLVTGVINPSSLSVSDRNDAFNFALGFSPTTGTVRLEHASAFSGPVQTPNGPLASASVDPIEANLDDPGLDRRLVRFVALVKNLPIPDAHATVYGLNAGVARAYEMTNVRFDSIAFQGLKEDLSFSTDSMSWTVGADTTEVQ
jgi:hypothetical protein